MKGFLLNPRASSSPSKEAGVVCEDDECILLPSEVLDLCHHVHTLIVSDRAFLDELEKRVRAGTNTESLASKYRDPSQSQGGCCGGPTGDDEGTDQDTVRMIQSVVMAAESQKKGLPGASGPTRSQLDDLVQNFKPADVPCCRSIRFRFVDNDPVGEILDGCLGKVNAKMARTLVEAISLSEATYEKVLNDIESEKRTKKSASPAPKKEKEKDEASDEGNENDFMKKLADSDHPLLQNMKAILDPNAEKTLSKPIRGSADDKFSRQLVLKESLVKVLRVKVQKELAKRNKSSSSTGGLTATPGGWKLCPLDFIPRDALSQLFSSEAYARQIAATKVVRFMTPVPSVLEDIRRIDSDGLLRPVEGATRSRKGWISIESFNQSKFQPLTQFMLRLGSIPFEINKKCGFHLQIPDDFLFERTYLHPPSATHHENELQESVLRPRSRLECGSSGVLDNGRVLVCLFCLEAPKIPSRVYLSKASEERDDVPEDEYILEKGSLVMFKAVDTLSRVEHFPRDPSRPSREVGDDDSVYEQDGASTIITLYLKGFLK